VPDALAFQVQELVPAPAAKTFFSSVCCMYLHDANGQIVVTYDGILLTCKGPCRPNQLIFDLVKMGAVTLGNGTAPAKARTGTFPPIPRGHQIVF
jgi:hypothetical protein